MNSWISVNASMPPNNTDVLALREDGKYYVLQWTGSRWINEWCVFGWSITHWKRLPEKPIDVGLDNQLNCAMRLD